LKLSAVIPAQNEEGSIAETVESLIETLITEGMELAMATRRTRKSTRGKSTRSKTARKPTSSRKRRASARHRGGRKWSARVTRESDALDLDRGVFKLSSPKRIAASLKRSAEHSRRRKADAYRSALSMLTFYINRAGRNLPASRKRTLNKAKDELRVQFGRA
jgi:hypothetical protein